MNLHRLLGTASEAINFTVTSIQDILSAVKVSGFIFLSIRGYKINKIRKLLNKINSTESYTRDMVLKIILEPRDDLNMFKKNYQALCLQDKLIMHLTLHELAY